MKTVSAAKISAEFDDYLKACREQPVLLTRNGKPVAVLMAVSSQGEAEKLAEDPQGTLRSIFQEADEQLRKGLGVPQDRFWREVEKSRVAKCEKSVRKREPEKAKA